MKYPRHHRQFNISYALIMILAVLVGTQVTISNRIATSGKVMSQLEQRAIEIEDENRKLLSDNVQAFSLGMLAEKAKMMGFIEPETIVHMDAGSSNLALKN